VCVDQLRSTHTARSTAELLATLASRASGWRIRYLRTVLGWNQRTAAARLGISVRTLIRHEQGHHRTSSTRLALLLRLLELELTHANEILAYVDRRERSRLAQREFGGDIGLTHHCERWAAIAGIAIAAPCFPHRG